MSAAKLVLVSNRIPITFTTENGQLTGHPSSGGLVSAQPNSPHLLAPKIKAKLYFGIASSDDKTQPEAKDKLKEAFPAAKIEVYADALHGWCIPDMPLTNGMPTYNKADAERAWGELLALYKTALA